MMQNEKETEKCCDDDISNKPQISVILLIGLPASGKSTLARELKERFNQDDVTSNDRHTSEREEKDDETISRFIHIEYDDLEDFLLSSVDMEINGTSSNCNKNENRQRDAWNQARQHAMERMEQEIQKISKRGELSPSSACSTNTSSNISNRTVILMDDNFHFRGMRKKIHRLLLSYRPISFGIIYLATPVKVCLERNRNRLGRRQIHSDIIFKMSTLFETPRAAWEVCSTKTVVNYKSAEDDTKFDDIVKFIEFCPNIVELPPDAATKYDLGQQAADRAKTRLNRMHNLDKLLRCYVGRVAKFDKTFAKKANLARKKVIEEFKAGRSDNSCVTDAFLNFILPLDASLMNETGSISHSSIRSQLREVLDSS